MNEKILSSLTLTYKANALEVYVSYSYFVLAHIQVRLSCMGIFFLDLRGLSGQHRRSDDAHLSKLSCVIFNVTTVYLSVMKTWQKFYILQK